MLKYKIPQIVTLIQFDRSHEQAHICDNVPEQWG